MKVTFKKITENAVLPYYGSDGAAGLDMTATSKFYDEFGNVVYGTGLAGKLPKGHVGLLFPRSSNAKQDLILSNSVGVWDEDYTKEIFFKFKPSVVYCQDEESSISDNFEWIGVAEITDEYNVGDRIGQLLIIPYPKIEPEWIDKLEETNRGGYGSTGK